MATEGADQLLMKAADHLRQVAEVMDVPQDQRGRALARNDREKQVVKAARAYGLRWAADIIDPREDS